MESPSGSQSSKDAHKATKLLFSVYCYMYNLSPDTCNRRYRFQYFKRNSRLLKHQK